ncbi:unnamed protein product [Durusdinium trenchii]|uniref:Uncharacterized protein n=1 Tax=Durusdinium trenchii TaxID=1381693 RepID=A0ABP0N3F2_9DINO
MPDSDAPFLHSTDGRRPLSLKELKAFIVSDQAKRSASGCQGTVMLLEGTLTCDVRRRGCLRDLFFCSMG